MRNFVILVTLSLLLALPIRGQDAFVHPDGRTVAMNVAVDRVGVTLGRPNQQLASSLGSRFGLQLTAEGEGDLYVFAAPGPRSREQLLDLAARLRDEQGVKQAGLVVREEGKTTPNLVSNELVVYGPALTPGPWMAAFPGLHVVAPNPYVPGQYLMAGVERADAFALSRAIRALGGVSYAVPNFVSVDFLLETIPTDPLFASQWHHRNTGASGGTSTADARTTLAWDFTQGISSTLLTIYELFGFDVAHEDLAAGLWTNPGEIAGNGIDDDGNGNVDDINGWDYTPCSTTPGAGCGSATLTPAADTSNDAHATSVAGTAVARDNTVGVVGSCPNCTFQPTFRSSSAADFYKSLPFDYARVSGAAIVNNSWSGSGVVPVTQAAITNAAANGRGGLGTVIFFAAGNTAVDVCTGASMSPYVSHADVIGITSSSNLDKKVQGHAFGNCVEMMAPTRWSPSDPVATGTLAVTTTDRTSSPGYNVNNPTCIGGLVEPADTNYTNCFSGTSSATPLASGVAGLVLSTDPTLTRIQVRNALQDTADKTEDSLGDYDTANAFSTPGTHGYGRINAFEAVRLFAPVVDGGRAGTDIFVRDNRLDWGNTDHDSNVLLEPTRGFLAHWKSEDIKVDAPPLEATPPANNADFEAFVHENAIAGQLNKVYVRVRNRGPVTAGDVDVKLHWAFAGAGLPDLPSDFWTAWPADSADTTIWHPLGLQPVTNLAYSGASEATTAGDAAQIVTFDFTAPAIDPLNPNPDHHCLLAVIDSPTQDRPDPLMSATTPDDFIPDDLTPRDNNVTHRNITVVEDEGGVENDYVNRIYIANPAPFPVTVIMRGKAPTAWTVRIDGITLGQPITLAAKERRLVTVRIRRGSPQAAEVGVIQETYINQKKVVGGMTYLFKQR